ncbi:hypothetical protein LIER_42258 [Lithospermum erythrorhizon]|uniref:GAG-pre-integrase domain-containing protein n=1 Tax=Lithospermum erythrorhizon TaxID=34254 RepID=A0AAV3RNQ5_LITER
MVGNGAQLPITHTASTTLHNFKLNNVPLVPHLKKNLISIHKLCQDNHFLAEFSPSSFIFKDQKTHKPRLSCSSQGSLYPFHSAVFQVLSSQVVSAVPLSSEIWHNRLGHPSSTVISSLVQKKLISYNLNSSFSCNVCQLGKNVKKYFQSSITTIDSPFALVFSDVWESSILSPSGFKYYVVFIDAHTCYT